MSHLLGWLKGMKQNKQKITSVGENVEKFSMTGGSVKWFSHYEKQYGNSSKD